MTLFPDAVHASSRWRCAGLEPEQFWAPSPRAERPFSDASGNVRTKLCQKIMRCLLTLGRNFPLHPHRPKLLFPFFLFNLGNVVRSSSRTPGKCERGEVSSQAPRLGDAFCPRPSYQSLSQSLVHGGQYRLKCENINP